MINDENNKVTNNVSPETGRFFFSLLIGLFIFGELISMIAGDLDISRIIIGSLLLFLVYEGYRWARVLLGVLAGLIGIVEAIALIDLIPAAVSWAVPLAILSIAGASFGMMVILLFSKSMTAFLEMRRR